MYYAEIAARATSENEELWAWQTPAPAGRGLGSIWRET